MPDTRPAMQVIETLPVRAENAVFDFHRSWIVVKQACTGHKYLIFLTCLLTVGFLGAYLYLWPPIFYSDVELVAESDKDMTREGFYQAWDVFRKDSLPDEVQMLTSAPVLTKVVDELGLTYNDVYHPFLDHAGYLWQESWPGRTYKRVKEWLFAPKRGPYDPTPQQIDRARTVYDFKEGVQVDSIAGTNVGKLVVRGPSARVAQMANTIAKVYFELRRERHVKEAEDAYTALQAELVKAGDDLGRFETQMQEYYAKNQLLLTFEKDKLDVTQWTALKGSILDLQSTIASQEGTLREINAELVQEPKTIVSVQVMAPNPIAQSLKDKLAQLEVSREQMLLHFRPDAPEVRDVERQIAVLKGDVARTPASAVQQTSTVINETYEGLRRKKETLEAELPGERAALQLKQAAAADFQAMANQIPEKMKMQHELEREHSALEKKYSLLQEKLMVAAVSKVTAVSAPATIHVIAPAEPPSAANWPRTKLLLAGAVMFSLVAGVVLALLVDLIYARVHRYMPEGEKGGLPLYAIVGRDRSLAARLFAPRTSGTRPAGSGGPMRVGRRVEVGD